jgi:hypothetical protein
MIDKWYPRLMKKRRKLLKEKKKIRQPNRILITWKGGIMDKNEKHDEYKARGIFFPFSQRKRSNDTLGS